MTYFALLCPLRFVSIQTILTTIYILAILALLIDSLVLFRYQAIRLGLRGRASFVRANLWTHPLGRYENTVIFGVEQMVGKLASIHGLTPLLGENLIRAGRDYQLFLFGGGGVKVLGKENRGNLKGRV
jgi:hypothetical protein